MIAPWADRWSVQTTTPTLLRESGCRSQHSLCLPDECDLASLELTHLKSRRLLQRRCNDRISRRTYCCGAPLRAWSAPRLWPVRCHLHLSKELPLAQLMRLSTELDELQSLVRRRRASHIHTDKPANVLFALRSASTRVRRGPILKRSH